MGQDGSAAGPVEVVETPIPSDGRFVSRRKARTMSETPYLSVHEVAKRFGVTATTIYRLAQRGALPGFKVGNQWRFSLPMLESWVADQVTVEWLKAEDQEQRRLKQAARR